MRTKTPTCMPHKTAIGTSRLKLDKLRLSSIIKTPTHVDIYWGDARRHEVYRFRRLGQPICYGERHLEQPVRAIHCLEQIKDKMASVLKGEGYALPGDGIDDPRIDEVFDADLPEIQPHDGENTGQAMPHGLLQAGEESSRSRASKKRLSNGDLKDSMSSKLKTTSKKVRNGPGLPCPFRKHNPHHFNIRQYEGCALRSYVDMASLKKHLLSVHHKPKQPCSTCERCQQTFEDQHSTIEHMQQCPAPPRPANMAEIAGPVGEFDDDVKARLKSRDGKNKINDWNSLWRLLFPGTTTIPDPNFEPVIEYHDISATAKEENTMNTEVRDHLQRQLQMLFEKTKSNLSGYRRQNDMSYHIPVSTDSSGESSMFSPEGFVHVRPEPLQTIEPLGDVLAVEEVPAHCTFIGGSMRFLNSSQVSQRSHSQVLGSTPLFPDLGQLDNLPQSTHPIHNSFVTSMVSRQAQTTNYLMGLATRGQVPSVSTDGLFMDIGSVNAPPTYMPRMDNTGIRNSATWPSADTDFNNGQDMSWNNGTLSYENAGRRA
ncbi:hypothetical protein G7054_g13703 [Neopestalotiopsis clavispora]|nr:hypothetical protein G7054_g13703 [Neopestalotiopsis clavispora]